MIDELANVVVRKDMTVEHAAAKAEKVPAPTEEQVQTADVVFVPSVPTAENRVAAAILGMWTGTLALHGMLVDHLARPPMEEEEEEEHPPQLEPRPEEPLA
jgi:hypothetical protein